MSKHFLLFRSSLKITEFLLYVKESTHTVSVEKEGVLK